MRNINFTLETKNAYNLILKYFIDKGFPIISDCRTKMAFTIYMRNRDGIPLEVLFQQRSEGNNKFSHVCISQSNLIDIWESSYPKKGNMDSLGSCLDNCYKKLIDKIR